MVVLDHAPVGEGPVGAAGGDDRHLLLEVDERLQDGLAGRQRRPTRRRVRRRRDQRLPLAVVPPAGGLEDGRAAEPGDGGGQLGQTHRPGSQAATGNAVVAARNAFSRRRCWVTCRTDPPGRTGANVAAAAAVAAGTFSNSNVTTDTDPGEGPDGVQVVVGGRHLDVGHLAGRRVVVGRERGHPVPHLPGGDGEHPAQLAAAEDAEGGTGNGGIRVKRDRPRTRSPGLGGCHAAEDRAGTLGLVGQSTAVRLPPAVRRAASPAIPPSVPARMATASRAALTAPARPMATVATGTPAGICTMLSSESTPRSTADSTGTPITGNDGVRRHHPRQVRRPARPGDHHPHAPSLGRRRVLRHQPRRPVGRQDPALPRHAELPQRRVGVPQRLPVGPCSPSRRRPAAAGG